MVRKPDASLLHTASKFGGGALLIIGLCLFVWLIFFQHPTASMLPLQGISSTATTDPMSGSAIQTPALQAAGISLAPSGQLATVSQEQALQLANQQQPDAAATAKKIEVHYGLLNVKAQNLHNIVVWMIWYQNIPQPPNEVEVSNSGAHDFYIFIDAKTGQTVLSIWV